MRPRWLIVPVSALVAASLFTFSASGTVPSGSGTGIPTQTEIQVLGPPLLPTTAARTKHRHGGLGSLPSLPDLRLPAPSNPFWQTALDVEHRPPWPVYRLALARARYLRPFVLVFVFHQVCPTDWPLRNGPDYITPQRLAEDLAFFRYHHIDMLTAKQFLGFLTGKTSVPNGSVFLTFDNGLEGVYQFAFPIVKAYHAHITLFLIGGRMHDVWRPGERYLSWNQVRTMVHSGYVDAESETFDLHHIQRVAPNLVGPAVLRTWDTYPRGHWEPIGHWEQRIWRGLLLQRMAFYRHLGYAPNLLVWPFSTYTPLAEVEAHDAGYVAAFAVYPGIVTQRDNLDRYALPRNPATYMWDNVPWEYEVLTHSYDQGPLLADEPSDVNQIPVVTLGTTPPPES